MTDKTEPQTEPRKCKNCGHEIGFAFGIGTWFRVPAHFYHLNGTNYGCNCPKCSCKKPEPTEMRTCITE